MYLHGCLVQALPAAALGQWLIVFFYIIQRVQIIGMMSFSQEILKIISLYLLPFSSKSRSKSQVVCSHTYCGCFQSSETNLPRAGNIRLYCAQELLVYYLFSTLPQTGPAGQAGVQPASLGGLTFGNCDSFSLSLLFCTSTRLPYIR